MTPENKNQAASDLSASSGSASVKETLEKTIIPIAYEMLKCHGKEFQWYVDLNEMWIELYDEQLFPTQNKKDHR